MFRQHRKSIVLFIAGIFLTILITTMVIQATTVIPSTIVISSGVYPGALSYMIWPEGTSYFAKDAYGYLVYSDTNATAVWDYVRNLATKGTVLFGSGDFYFDSGQVLIKSNVNMKGVGQEATHFYLGYGVEIQDDPTITTENVTISDLTVSSGNTTASFSFGGLAGTRRRYISLQHVRVICNEPYPGTAGLNIFFAGPNDGDVDAGILDEHNSMFDVTFQLTIDNDADAVSISFQRWFILDNCHIEARTAIYKCRDSVFSNNVVTFKNDWGNFGVWITGISYNIVISGNDFYGNGEDIGPAIMVAGTVLEPVRHITIDGNTIFNFYNAIQFVGVENSIISSNTIWNTTNSGIYLGNVFGNYSNYNIISGNNIMDANSHLWGGIAGIYLVNANYTQISGNLVRRFGTTTLHYGIALDTSFHNNIDGFTGIGLSTCGIYETGGDYNSIINANLFDMTFPNGIVTVGTHTHVNCSWNGATWMP